MIFPSHQLTASEPFAYPSVKADEQELRLVSGDANGCAPQEDNSVLKATDVLMVTPVRSGISQTP